jgi:GNAT superfamily N-acetyltransferase
MQIEMVSIRNLRDKREWIKRFMLAYHGDGNRAAKICDRDKYFRATFNGQEVGFVLLRDTTMTFREVTNRDVWYLELMFVNEEHRNRGIARAMIEWAIRHENVVMINITDERVMNNSSYYYDLGFRIWETEDDDDLGMAILGDFQQTKERLNREMGFRGSRLSSRLILPTNNFLKAA